MPRLIHLNGPPAVGKSTLARRYADAHPGTLVLDLDVLAGWIGGWKEDFSGALKTARIHARALAELHLRAGHDVIVPQLVTVHDRDPDPTLQSAAAAAGAHYLQVALTLDDDAHLHRLRARCPATAVEEHVQARLIDPASDLVERIRGHLQTYLAERPDTLRLDTTGLTAEESYVRLLHLLDVDS